MLLHHPKASIFDAAFGPAIGSCDPDRAFLRLRSGAPKVFFVGVEERIQQTGWRLVFFRLGSAWFGDWVMLDFFFGTGSSLKIGTGLQEGSVFLLLGSMM